MLNDDNNIRVYNRHKLDFKTSKPYQFGTLVGFDGCLAVIQMDGIDWINYCVPSDYKIIEGDKLLSELIVK